MQFNNVVVTRAVLMLLPLAAITFHSTPAYADEDGAVYVMSNAASGNSVLVFEREENGKLHYRQDVATGGKGTGGTMDPLGSQGALTMSTCGRHLFAVNAGSNQLSVLGVGERHVWLEHVAGSGGVMPISVTNRGDRVYVLNAGGTPNVTGFWVGFDGRLTPIPGGKHVIPGGSASGPAEVSFDPDGDALIVTEKTTSMIDIFGLRPDGAIKDVASAASTGTTPFGFSFGRRGTLVVSNAGGTNGSTVSSYWVEDDDDVYPATLNPITEALPLLQNAACWIAVTPNGRYAFSANAASSTISSLRVTNEGALTLLDKAAATVTAGSVPTDIAVSRHGRYLYVLGAVKNSLFVYRIDDGTLTWVETVSNIPASAQGVAAR